MPVDSQSNEIQFIGNFANEEVYFAFSAMHRIIDLQRYKDISLNFSRCEKAYSAAMLPICAFCIKLWKLGIDVHLELPIQTRLKSLFLATNWAHFIDHRQWTESRNRGFTHSPAIRFASGADQNKAVNKGMDVVLAAVQHLSRDELRYLEWVLTELTDNVINHAESLCGGLLQITNHRDRKEVEFVVSDAGLGIPATLKPSLNTGYSDAEVLHRAIQENVTRDKAIGQGNGLYGSWRIAQISGGQFSIFSGYGKLSSPEKGDIRSSTSKIPFNGTTVQARLGYDRGVDLSEAMVFPGKTFAPVDYLETHFAEDENGDITFVLSEESDGFGSRAAARPVRRKLENLIRQTGVGIIHVDLGNIKLISSSYADELFGKLFIILGPMNFMQRIKLKRVDSLVMGLIDRAITQRSMQGYDKASEIES